MKAFGKLDLFSPLPLRGFEVYFKIKARKGAGAWISAYVSVQNLLDHMQRFTKSESSKEIYLNGLRRFCEWSGRNPDELVHLPKYKAEKLVQNYADHLAAKDSSKAYVNSIIKRLKTFFRINGFTDNSKLNVHSYFVPTRYRKLPEYVPTKTEVLAMADAAGSRRDRAIILTLWSSGLRVSTLCSLNFGDLAEELERGELYIMISVFPSMKNRVLDACKGQIPYYTFICPQAGEALRNYLTERRTKFGEIEFDDPLFHSNWSLWAREERSKRRLGRRAVELIVKRAAKFTRIQQWKYITPHSLRKACELILRSPTINSGRLDKGTQEFFMGHILQGVQDVYYDKTKVNFHREEYAKLDFSRNEMSMRKTVDKLIDIAELESYLCDNWLFLAKITDNRVVIRKSG